MDNVGDFNDNRCSEEKKRGKMRQESSFRDFREFIVGMGMGEKKFQGDTFTWANNREGEGFIQERLDRMFGSADWMVQQNLAVVRHILRQASDHSMLLLDTHPLRQKNKGQIYI